MLVEAAEPLAGQPEREIIVVATVPHAEQLGSLSRALEARRERLLERGVAARSAAFTSVTPGADVARLATEHDVDLLLVDAPEGLLEDARLLTLLEQAPCDVAVVAGARSWPPNSGEERSAVLVPFGGGLPRLGGGRARSLAGAQHGRAAATGGSLWTVTAGGMPAGCWPAPRSPYSTPWAFPRSRCWWRPTPTR